jgi:tripartite-type tricarboxylate transporter receptor subunit TctC
MASRQQSGYALTAALGGALLLLGASAFAQDAGNYPNRPVIMIVPFAPGGASDFVARTIQTGVGEILGQQIVVDNRPGAAGIIGTEVAARAAPDGYTIFLGNIGTLSINASVYSNMRIKPDQDLAPVTMCADTPSILITRADFPASSVAELIAYVKANQGKVTFATPGSSTLNRLEMEVFRKDAGLDMVHVPYKGGAGPAVQDILGGHVDIMFTTIASAMAFVKDNKVKALAVTTRQRMAELPEVPTMHELGWKNLVTSSWQGVLAPSGTPHAIVEKLHAAIVKVLAEPAIQARMRNAGVIAVASKTPEEFRAYMDAETAKWARVIEQSGVRAD